MEITEKIDGLELIGNDDKELMKKTFEFFTTTPFGNTEFQIMNFVLNKVEYPTPFSKFRQSKLELWTRFQSLMEDHFQYREALANIELEKAKISDWSTDDDPIKKAKIKLSEINIDKNIFKMQVIKKLVQDKIREMNIFYRVTLEEEPKIKGDEVNEDLKVWEEKMRQQPGLFRERYGI